MIVITKDTFSQYYRLHVQTVYRVALGIVRIPEEAEDIVMECFTELINKASFSDENHVKAWLIVTAEHKALNVVKSARMRRNVPLEELPEQASHPNELCGEVRDMVMRLPEALKTVTYLFYFEEMPAAEISRTLGISENTVYKRLQKARKLLKLSCEEGLA